MSPDSLLLRRVRATYEWSRVRRGLRAACLVAPMVVASLGWCGNVRLTLTLGVALAISSAALVWRGGTPGKAVVPGLIAGMVSLAVPTLLSPACAIADGPDGIRYCLLACAAGGLASGSVVAHFASRRIDRTEFVAVAGSIAAAGGALGCMIVGMVGIASMLVGLCAVSLPAALRPQRTG